MSLLDRINLLKEKVDSAKRDRDRAEGAMQQTKKRLKDEHNCNSVPEARKKLKELEKASEKQKEEFETALREFEEKHATELSDLQESDGDL